MMFAHRLFAFTVCASLLVLPRIADATMFPQEKLPDHITFLVDSAERAEWSLDSRKVMYLDKTPGDAWEIDIASKEKRCVTEHVKFPEGEGICRAHYMSDSNYLFTAGTRPKAYLHIMDKSLTKQPVKFDLKVNEGPAVSRNSLRVVYTPNKDDIYLVEFAYKDGVPVIKSKEKIIDKDSVYIDGEKMTGWGIEPQNFRPPHDEELLFSFYGCNWTDLFGYNLKTKKFTNYSKADKIYDEAEGVFHDGKYSCVERGPRNTQIEVYALKLDGSTEVTRMTHFTDVEGFKASNPVVSDNGRYIAFQESTKDLPMGFGLAIYLLDIPASGLIPEYSTTKAVPVQTGTTPAEQ